MMNVQNVRFYLDADNRIVDQLNTADGTECVYSEQDGPADEIYLRNRLFRLRLSRLVDDLIINTNPMKRLPNGEEYKPFNDEAHSLWVALFNVIEATHLHKLDPALSVSHRCDDRLDRKKTGLQHFTSLSLFVHDVDCLLGHLYGDFNDEAMDRIRYAVFRLTEEFARYLRKDLWEEHQNATAIDYVLGIGVPDGCFIHGSDHSRANRAAHELALRARAVNANPTAFSKYTVEFVEMLDRDWNLRPADEKEERALLELEIPPEFDLPYADLTRKS
jgi:hypothetical protein